MFKKSILACFGLALFLAVSFNSNAGFSLKNVIKGKKSNSSSSSSSSSNHSGAKKSNQSNSNIDKLTIKNEDPIGYKFQYNCSLNKDPSYKHVILKPGKTLVIEGDNCTYHFMPEYKYDEKEGVIPGRASTQHGRTRNIPFGEGTLTMKFGAMHDANSLKWHTNAQNSGRYHSDFFSNRIQGEVTKKYKGKSYSSAISYMNKLLKTRPKTSNKKETTWVVNRPEFGDYCVHVWGKHLNTKPNQFAYASASEYKKSSSYCRK